MSGERATSAHDQRIRRAGMYDGFEAYRSTTEDDLRQVLSEGMMVPDTNVLLNLYRYTTEARADLIAVLKRLEDRLWVPHQVLAEFWRNRERAARGPEDAAERALDALSTQQGAATQALRTWANRVALEAGHLNELENKIQVALDEVQAAISTSLEREGTTRSLDTNADPVLQELADVLEGRVGPPIGDEERRDLISEASRRFERKVPPGYLDAGKTDKENPDAAFGDYILWEQILREAEQRRADVLVVTGDVKDDWWRRVEGEARGPRLELVDEMRTRAGVRLFLLRPDSLLVHARRVLQVDVRDESLEDVERVDRYVATTEAGEWTTLAVQQLLARLDAEGPVQADAIRRAAAEGGFVSRDTVYELGGYDASRTLRGFSRPATRIAQDLRDRGLIPDTAPDPLEAVYDPAYSWVLAHGFRVPPQLADVVQRDVQGS